jgi:hypothetical protein
MSNLRNTQKVNLFAIVFIAAALIGSVIAIAGDNNAAFATKKEIKWIIPRYHSGKFYC